MRAHAGWRRRLALRQRCEVDGGGHGVWLSIRSAIHIHSLSVLCHRTSLLRQVLLPGGARGPTGSRNAYAFSKMQSLVTFLGGESQRELLFQPVLDAQAAQRPQVWHPVAICLSVESDKYVATRALFICRVCRSRRAMRRGGVVHSRRSTMVGIIICCVWCVCACV